MITRDLSMIVMFTFFKKKMEAMSDTTKRNKNARMNSNLAILSAGKSRDMKNINIKIITGRRAIFLENK